MLLKGYTIPDDKQWHSGSCGKTILATKGGKKYFIKQFVTVKHPLREGTDPAVYDKNVTLFNKFVAYRSRLNSTLRAITGSGGNIIIPVEEFAETNATGFSGCAPIHYTEVSDFIEGAVKDEDLESVLTSLTIENKEMIFRTAAAALSTVHSNNVVHGDLKLKNILLIKNAASGMYIAKLIDFDSSFFIDDKSMGMGGDELYLSPELLKFSGMEDASKEELRAAAEGVNEKTDIFSLGIIFHYYMSGELPEVINLTDKLREMKTKRIERATRRGKHIDPNCIVTCAVGLANGCSIKISDKIKDIRHIMLINDMLNPDPEKRPSASKVLRRLRDTEVPFTMEEPWPEHELTLSADKIKGAGFVMLKRADGGKYDLIARDGSHSLLTDKQMLDRGYALSAIIGVFEEPWPEHKVTLNVDKVKAKGFVALKRKEFNGVKGYALVRPTREERFMPISNMQMLGYATVKGAAAAPKVTPTPAPARSEGFAEPWPEHPIKFNMDKITSRGYIGSKQTDFNGVKGYKFLKADGSERFMKYELLLMNGFAVKK